MGEAAPAARVRLLVVDDEVYNRDLLVRTFARDCDVVAASSVADGLATSGRFAFVGTGVGVIGCTPFGPGLTTGAGPGTGFRATKTT